MKRGARKWPVLNPRLRAAHRLAGIDRRQNRNSNQPEETNHAQSAHHRLAKLHNLAAHTHSAAAVAHERADHLTAHELIKQAHEHSMNLRKLSEELLDKRDHGADTQNR
jgi:hypothetical protein